MTDDGMGLFRELEKLMNNNTGPVNWELASQVAVKSLHDRGLVDPDLTSEQGAQVTQALQLADHWLDPVTALPSAISATKAWTRRQWLAETLPAWGQIVDPVADRVVAAVRDGMTSSLQQLMEDGDLPPEVAGSLPPGMDLSAIMGQLGSGPMQQMMNQVSGMVFGSQVGQALSLLVGIVCGGGDVGLALTPRSTAVLLPANVAGFTAEVALPADEVRLHLALREAAAVRLLSGVPWLAEHLNQAVRDYAQGMEIDASALTQSLQSLDPMDPTSFDQAEGFFSTAAPLTGAQQMALSRLETVLALVEGWIEVVVSAASEGRLPHSAALREATRRRRAEGGPAEQTFTALVGLELRPRRVRDAATLWAHLESIRGITGRDGVWVTPDLLPGATDLDDPLAYAGDATDEGSAFPDDPMSEIARLDAEANREDGEGSTGD